MHYEEEPAVEPWCERTAGRTTRRLRTPEGENPVTLHPVVRQPLAHRAAAFVPAVLTVGLLLTLCGCAAPMKYKRPEVKLNSSWTQNAADSGVSVRSVTEAGWWTAFQDPTLDELIRLAHSQNLELRSTGLRIYQARAQLAIAVGRQYPQVQAAFASASAVRISENAANNFGANQHFGDYQLGFDADWEVDFWGRFRGEVEAAGNEYMASAADYADAIVSLTAEVGRTYTVLRTFEVLVELAKTNTEVQEEGLRIAQARFKFGATSELDVAQATTLLESTRSSIPRFELGRQQAENALATLLGQPPGSLTALLARNSGIPVAPGDVAMTMPAELLRRRPDVRATELFAAAQGARIGVAKADLYPRFSLFGQLGFQTSSGGGAQSNHAEFSDLFDGGSFFYLVGPRIFWPFWNYGRIRNNIRLQDARFQQLLVDYQDSVLKAAQEVEDGLVGYVKSKEATVFSERAAEAAQKSVDLSMVQYREGAVDYQRVLDAQRSLLEEENALAQSHSAITTNLISLYKALGGGWEVRAGQPVIPEEMIEQMKERTNWGDLLSEPAPELSNAPSGEQR